MLIHGFAGNRGVWADLQPALAGSHTVLAVDLPGCGQSAAPPPGAVDFGAVADRVAKTMAAARLGPSVVVAHSMGGLVAIHLAARHPKLVKGLMLLDAPLRPMGQGQAEALAAALERNVAQAFRDRYGAFAASPAQLDRVVAEAARIPGPILAAYTRGRTASLEKVLSQVTCPVGLIASPILLPDPAQEAALVAQAGYGAFRDLRVRRLEKARHWLFWDDPKAVLAEIQGMAKSLDAKRP